MTRIGQFKINRSHDIFLIFDEFFRKSVDRARTLHFEIRIGNQEKDPRFVSSGCESSRETIDNH